MASLKSSRQEKISFHAETSHCNRRRQEIRSEEGVFFSSGACFFIIPKQAPKGGGEKEHRSRRQPWLSVPPPSQRRSAYIRPSTLYIRPSTPSRKKFQTGYCWLFPVSNPARCSMGEKGMGKCRRKKKRTIAYFQRGQREGPGLHMCG